MESCTWAHVDSFHPLLIRRADVEAAAVEPEREWDQDQTHVDQSNQNDLRSESHGHDMPIYSKNPDGWQIWSRFIKSLWPHYELEPPDIPNSI